MYKVNGGCARVEAGSQVKRLLEVSSIYLCVCIFERYFEDRITWTWWYYGCGGPVRARQGVGLSSGADGGAI